MTIPDLIERLEKATGPDRDLDEMISAALFPEHEFMQLKDAPEGVGCMMYRWPDGQQASALRATSSIDAAVKLCELALQTYRLDLCIDPSGIGAEIMWWPNGLSQPKTTSEKHVSDGPEKAIIVCLLRCLQSEEPR